METKALLFDFNGTLIFDTEIIDLGWKRLFKEYMNIVPTQDELNAVAHGTSAKHTILYFDKDIDSKKLDELIFLIDVYYRESARNREDLFKLAPGAIEFLDTVKQMNIPLSIATSSPILNIDLYYELLKIDRWFDRDLLMYNDGSFPGKPAPDIYMLAAKKLGLDISECIVFEDAVAGVQSAKNAGAKKIIAITDLNNDEDLIEAGADIVFHDYLDIEQLLKEIV